MNENETSSGAAPWLQYKHAVVRDLAWLLLSPPLFIEELSGYSSYQIAQESLTQSIESWLAELDTSCNGKLTSNGHSIDRKKFRRLGLYCETLLDFFFKHAPWEKSRAPVDTIRNFRIEGQSQTIGECDFLLPYRSGIAQHIELAVKFYLQYPYAEREWTGWLGPNAVDRLDLKVSRMVDHQLTLPLRHDTKTYFETFTQKFEIDKGIESFHLLKGMLFVHAQEEDAQFRTPLQANEQLLQGEWMHVSEFLEYENQNIGECFLCDKMDWLTGPEDLSETLGLDEVTEKMRDIYGRAYENRLTPPGLMLIMLDEKQGQKRIMVVPDHWPEINSPLRNM